MPRASFSQSIFSLLVGCCMILRVVAPNCYHLDGSNGGPTNTLCNPNATGQAGSHSACCNVQNADACLSTGLCLNTAARQQSHFLWSTGCTDATFSDPACPQYCHDTNYDNAHLKSCNDTTFCCESDADILTTEACCNNSFRLTQPIGTVIAQLQSGVGAIPVATSLSSGSITAASTDIPSGALAGLIVEGVMIALTLMILGFFIWRNMLLNRRLKEAEGTAVEMQPQQQQQQQQQVQQLQEQLQQYQQQIHYWQHPPPSVGARSEMATTEGDTAKLNELPGMEPPELPSSSMDPMARSQ